MIIYSKNIVLLLMQTLEMAEFLEAVLVGLSELLIRARMEFLGSAQDLGSTLKMFSIQPILTAIQNWIAQANWISLIFFLFGGANIAFLIHETLARYKGVKWVIEHPIPAQVLKYNFYCLLYRKVGLSCNLKHRLHK